MFTNFVDNIKMETNFFFLKQTASQSYELTLRNQFYPEWVNIMLLGLILLLAIISFLYPSFISIAAKDFFKVRRGTELLDAEIPTNIRFTSYIFSFLSISLFSYISMVALGKFSEMKYAFIPVIYFIWILISIKIVSILTQTKQSLLTQVKNLRDTFTFIGVITLPLSFLLILNTAGRLNMLYAAFILYLIVWIYRIFKSLLNAFQDKFSWYYLILYFCTLELWPIILLTQNSGYFF